MKIKMLVGMSGADFSLSPREETDRFSDKEAAGLIDAGFAVAVDGKKTETAVRKPASEKRG